MLTPQTVPMHAPLHLIKPALLAVTVLLGGCLATTPPSAGLASSAAAAADGRSVANPERMESGTSVLAPGGAAAGAPAGRPQEARARLFDAQMAELDLMRPDGSACRAVSDGGSASNLLLFGQIGATLALTRFADRGQYNRAALQASLDSVKPQLKQVSRQIVWLPQDVEVHIGQQFLRLGDYGPWRPVNPAQRRFVQNVLTPMFEQLRSYASGELQSPLGFQLRLFADQKRTSPEMLPGGLLMVPSGMVALLASEKDAARAEQVLAFQLAHEFSHALRRHTTKQVQARLVDGLTMADVFQNNFRGTRQQLVTLGGGNFAQLFNVSSRGVGQILGALCASEAVFNAFDQTQELEADTCGALLLDKLSQNRPVRFNPLAGYVDYQRLVSQRLGPSALARAAAPPAAALKKFCVQAAQHPEPSAREANLARYWVVLQGRPGAGQGAGRGAGAPGLQDPKDPAGRPAGRGRPD